MMEHNYNITVSLTLLRQIANISDFHKRAVAYNNLGIFYLLKTHYKNSGINPQNSTITSLSKTTGCSYSTIKRSLSYMLEHGSIIKYPWGALRLIGVHEIKYKKHCREFTTVPLNKSMTLKEVVAALQFAYLKHNTQQQSHSIKEKSTVNASENTSLPVDETLSLSVKTMSNFFNCHRRTISRYKKKWVNQKLAVFTKRLEFVCYATKEEWDNMVKSNGMFITNRGCVLNRLSDSFQSCHLS